MGVTQLTVTQSVTHAEALQFSRKAHREGGHQGKRVHTRDCLETASITKQRHISSSSRAGSGVSFLLLGNNNKADTIYQLWGERTFTFSWTDAEAVSEMQVKVTPSQTQPYKRLRFRGNEWASGSWWSWCMLQMQAIVHQLPCKCEWIRIDSFPPLQTHKRSHKALSKEAFLYRWFCVCRCWLKHIK